MLRTLQLPSRRNPRNGSSKKCSPHLAVTETSSRQKAINNPSKWFRNFTCKLLSTGQVAISLEVCLWFEAPLLKCLPRPFEMAHLRTFVVLCIIIALAGIANGRAYDEGTIPFESCDTS
jgi:hypothetical protein